MGFDPSHEFASGGGIYISQDAPDATRKRLRITLPNEDDGPTLVLAAQECETLGQALLDAAPTMAGDT
jgi:hypothetical protein